MIIFMPGGYTTIISAYCFIDDRDIWGLSK